MSNIPPETVDVLKEVARLTQQGRLSWDIVRVPRETGAVYVALASGQVEFNGGVGARGADIEVSIRDEEGRPIYSFRIHSSQEDPLFDELFHTYQLARQQALKAPETLNKMRRELATR